MKTATQIEATIAKLIKKSKIENLDEGTLYQINDLIEEAQSILGRRDYNEDLETTETRRFMNRTQAAVREALSL